MHLTRYLFSMLIAASTVAQAQTLTVTNNLTLWLKSDTVGVGNGNPVGFWGDNSTNQNDAVSLSAGGSPTFVTNGINGRPALQFDGTTDFLALTNKVDPTYGPRVRLPNGLTMIAVFKTTSADTARVYAGNAPQTLIGDNTGATYSEFGLNGGKGEYNHYTAGWNYVDGSTALNNTNSYPGHYLIATHRPSDGLVNLYADSVFQATTNLAYQTTYTGISRIGGGYINGSGTGDLFDGLIGEVLVYNGALSDSDRLSVQTYLNSRWLDVPEPSTISMIAAAAFFGWLTRSRRNS